MQAQSMFREEKKINFFEKFIYRGRESIVETERS